MSHGDPRSRPIRRPADCGLSQSRFPSRTLLRLWRQDQPRSNQRHVSNWNISARRKRLPASRVRLSRTPWRSRLLRIAFRGSRAPASRRGPRIGWRGGAPRPRRRLQHHGYSYSECPNRIDSDLRANGLCRIWHTPLPRQCPHQNSLPFSANVQKLALSPAHSQGFEYLFMGSSEPPRPSDSACSVSRCSSAAICSATFFSVLSVGLPGTENFSVAISGFSLIGASAAASGPCFTISYSGFSGRSRLLLVT